jgi:hypothetical protein
MKSAIILVVTLCVAATAIWAGDAVLIPVGIIPLKQQL